MTKHILSPMFRKELTLLSRQKKHFVLRALFLTPLLIGLGLGWQVYGTSEGEFFDFARFGEQVFNVLLAVQFGVLCFLMPGLTASVIVDEKERETLSLLLISNLRPTGVVVDKVVVRLLLALSLLLAGLPLALTLLVFGGVTVTRIIAGYGVTIAGILLGAGVGLFWSSLLGRLYTALLATYLSLLLYLLLPLLPTVLMATSQREFLSSSVIPVINPVYALAQVLSGTYDFWPYGLGFALLLFATLTWRACLALPDHVTRPPPNLLALLYHRYARLFSVKGRFGAPLIREHELREDPLFWRESRVSVFNSRAFLIRCAYGIVILLLIAIPVLVLTDFPFGSEPLAIGPKLEALYSLFLAIYAPLLIAYALITAANAFAGEREGRTLDVLLSTPVPGSRLLMAKLLGVINPLSVLCLTPFISVAALNVIIGIVWDVALPSMTFCLGFMISYLLALLAAVLGLYCSARGEDAYSALLDAAIRFACVVIAAAGIIGMTVGIEKFIGVAPADQTGVLLVYPVLHQLTISSVHLWLFVGFLVAAVAVTLYLLVRDVDRAMGRVQG